MYWDRTRTPISGWSARIAWSATRPSSVSGHPGIHDRYVRSRLADFAQQGFGVFRLRDDVDARVPQQP